MRKILGYLKEYAITVDKYILVLSALFAAFSIYANYALRLNDAINSLQEYQQFFCWYLVFLIAFFFPILLWVYLKKPLITNLKDLVVLIIVAPAIFSLKVTFNILFHFSSNVLENRYWNHVFYWPFRLLCIITLLLVIHKLRYKYQPFYGSAPTGFDAKPYLSMVLLMVPLIVLASFQKDFLLVYPKLKNIKYLVNGEPYSWLYKSIYELAYGSDFVSIELFFRGFLILAFSKWLGKDAILPMAVFYCTIHFGKPLAECISSFFGGIILGVVSYNTRTIYGGLIVHLGIAWLMEAAGYFGNLHLH